MASGIFKIQVSNCQSLTYDLLYFNIYFWIIEQNNSVKANFLTMCSEKMKTLLEDIEKLAEKVLGILRENCMRKSMQGDELVEELQENFVSVCLIHKDSHNILADFSSLRYDVIRMLIRGGDYSHALCLHICDGASEFHVYSKKGWVSFCPDKDAILITAGDQIQVTYSTQLDSD